jgi:VanZ family protein
VRWAIPGVVLTLVLVLSLWTDVSLGSDLRELVAHAAAYAAAAASLLVAGRPHGAATGWSIAGAAGIGFLLIAVGLVVEVSQLWVGREADPLDVLADAVGVGTALGMWFLLRSRWRARTARRRSGRPQLVSSGREGVLGRETGRPT